MVGDRDSERLRDDLLARTDPKGELAALLNQFRPLMDASLTKGLLGLMGVDSDRVAEPLAQADRLLDDMTLAILTFSPLGWAPSSSLPTDVYSDALATLQLTDSLDEAESKLIEGWNQNDKLLYRIRRLASLGAGNEDLGQVARRRRELVERALSHHRNEAYEASVPIALAQADGIVWDFTESRHGLFSSGSGRDHLLDNSTVAGLPEGLKPLSELFSVSMKESGATGSLSRHGILHGRELGYDTKANSTKVFVLLLAVIEWAQPRARTLAERKDREREEAHAGSDETDDLGRRLDTRGFEDAKASLRWLSAAQMGQWRHHGRYRAELDEIAPGSLGEERLRGMAQIHLAVTSGGREFKAWRVTPSGFCFGIAGRDGPPNEWYYSGPVAPPESLEAGDWRGFGELPPPDWV